MTVFDLHVITNRRRPASGLADLFAAARAYFAERREAKRRRAKEAEDIRHLRQLEPYLLRDAGVELGPLHTAAAHIVGAHAAVAHSHPSRSRPAADRKDR